MKRKFWTEEKIAKLKEFCYEGKSNKELAEYFGCDLKDIYAKRSQLKITIDKCKAATPNPELEKVTAPMFRRGLGKDVKKAFKALYDTLLLTIASDFTNKEDTEIYSQLCEVILALEEVYDVALKGVKA